MRYLVSNRGLQHECHGFSGMRDLSTSLPGAADSGHADVSEVPSERTLRANLRSNDWHRVVTTTRGWKWIQPFTDGDVLLT